MASKPFDLVVRGGTLVDGTGSEPRQADVGVSGGVITEVGRVSGKGSEEIDAHGLLVTPGFVDLHTHYDAQVFWQNTIEPSSSHGVTTILMGNCGVGFAPVKPEHQQMLIDIMEGVEDIPSAVMEAGLPFNWNSFPEYLDALDQHPTDLNIATQIAHSSLRLYVMGQRGADREVATPEEMHEMAAIVREAVAAGALGFSTSRMSQHRTKTGQMAPHETASEGELRTIVLALKDLGKGIIQTQDDFYDTYEDHSTECDMYRRLAQVSGRPLSFAVQERHWNPEQWRWVLKHMEDANRDGLQIRGQARPGPICMLIGLETSFNPFVACPTYVAELARLPAAEKAARMRDPEMKRKLLSEKPPESRRFEIGWSRKAESMYELGDPPNYSPPPEAKLDLRAARMGISPLELAYDLMVRGDGKTLLLFPIGNFCKGNLDTALTILKHPLTAAGGNDGGAHIGSICDASYPTQVLTYWARDREGERIPLPTAVKMISQDTAAVIGLFDRGVVRPGYRGDLNVIDHDRLTLHAPRAKHDFPAGGLHFEQPATGYVATIVNGVVSRRNGAPTGEMPGLLIRGAQSTPT